MTDNLNISETDSILEPCGGEGVFVDKILSFCPKAQIRVFELNPTAAAALRLKYSNYGNVSIEEADMLLHPSILSQEKLYDKIICNPPYGARADEWKKDELNRVYSELYTKESYTLFLYACINCLKEDGELCFIVPSTFLSLHRHLTIRRFILENTRIKELTLFPSYFFPGVNFGYSNLCVVTLRKSGNLGDNMSNRIRIRTGFSYAAELTDPASGSTRVCSQSEIYSNVDSAFMFNSNDRITELINGIFTQKIGDVASCVTGFYSGDDKMYLHPANMDVRNAKRYIPVSISGICRRELTAEERVKGILSDDCFVSIVKGGRRRYYKPDEWYMDWSAKALSEYRRSKKCRFQNAGYYFKDDGIAIPMIKSGSLSAVLIDGRLFDQSIVGVFPYDSRLTYYLLAFFNSDVCTRIISAINPTVNNSANYIKKIPYIQPSEEIFEEVDFLAREAFELAKDGKDTTDCDVRLNDIFNEIYQLD